MKISRCVIILLLSLLAVQLVGAERGVVMVPHASLGEVVLYRGSHALLIGVSDYTNKIHPVGTKQANGFGLFDMSGNVWEWTCSAYDAKYGGGEKQCSDKNVTSRRVIRGGSWGLEPRFPRSADRSGLFTDYQLNTIGFRLAQGEPE